MSKDNDLGWSDERQFVRPPMGVVSAMGALLVLCLLLLLSAAKLAHWFGYGLGVWVMAGLAVLHRSMSAARKRDHPARFVASRSTDRSVVALVAAGWLTGAVHAYYVFQVETVAQ